MPSGKKLENINVFSNRLNYRLSEDADGDGWVTKLRGKSSPRSPRRQSRGKAP